MKQVSEAKAQKMLEAVKVYFMDKGWEREEVEPQIFLNMDFDWSPYGNFVCILCEGLEYEWAAHITNNKKFADYADKIGIFPEPYAGYALGIYVK